MSPLISSCILQISHISLTVALDIESWGNNMWGRLSKLKIFGAALVICVLFPRASEAAEPPHPAKHMLSQAMQCKLWGAQAASAYSVHEYGRAEQLYRQALSVADSPGITPDDRVLLMTNLGAAYREEGKYSEAATTLKQAVSFAQRLYSAYDPKLDYVSRQYDRCLQRQGQGLELPPELPPAAAQLPAPVPIPINPAALPAPISAANGALPPPLAGAPNQGWMPDGFDFYRYWGPDPESDRYFAAIWKPYEALNAQRPMQPPPPIADYGNTNQGYTPSPNFQNQSRSGIPIGYAVGRRFNPGYYPTSSSPSSPTAIHSSGGGSPSGSAFTALGSHSGGGHIGGFGGGAHR